MTTKVLGQYMTVAAELQDFVYEKISNTGTILEPSFGKGHLLKKILDTNPNRPIVCCELDQALKPIVTFNEHQKVIYGDFLKHEFGERFNTIIGNPPYVKQTSGNLYLQFIEKCYRLLHTDGELIFIVPSDFIRLTSAAKLIEEMYNTGTFTNWFFPHDEHLFEGASIDVVVFRYQKSETAIHGQTPTPVIVNGEQMFCNMRNGILTFSKNITGGIPIADKFHVYVGLVSGKEDVFRVPFGTMNVLTDKDTIRPYIFTSSFPTENSEINAHLLANKATLMERKIRKFTESNWFEWGAPRNLTAMNESAGKPCIYIRNLTRKSEVAFKGTVQPFGGALLCLIPKTAMSQQIDSVVLYLNSAEFKQDYIFSGRFKIGHKQICNVLLAEN
jgi:adenine-specific DNA-methyltransferase